MRLESFPLTHPPELPVAERPRVEIAPLEAPGRFRLRLSGRLGRSWAAQLCTGLAARHLSVLRGTARRNDDAWRARFELERLAPRVDPHVIDYLGLCRSRAARTAVAPLRLERFSVAESLSLFPALDVWIEAPDRLGLLGALLERLAFLALVPDEMSIETRDGRALDRFRIRTAEGGLPSRSTQRVLREVLAGRLLR
jgi:UTP:GlnB (protein PII) uridylyltransferase